MGGVVSTDFSSAVSVTEFSESAPRLPEALEKILVAYAQKHNGVFILDKTINILGQSGELSLFAVFKGRVAEEGRLLAQNAMRSLGLNVNGYCGFHFKNCLLSEIGRRGTVYGERRRKIRIKKIS